MSADDFRDLVTEFDHSGVVDVVFQRWSGATVVNGIASDAGFAPLVITPPFAYVPNGAKKFLERLDVGDRERDHVFIWTWSEDLAGAPLNVLTTIEQVGRTRADRIVDNDTGLTYIVATQFAYSRQAKVSGAIGVLLDQS